MNAKINSSTEHDEGLISTEEAATLLANFRPCGTRGFTEAEAAVLLKWAEMTRISTVFLEAALAGGLETSLKGGEICFRLKDQLAFQKSLQKFNK